MNTKTLNYKEIRKQFAGFVSRNILGMMGMSCYYIVDTLFVAQSQGADGVAALNLVSPPYYLIFAVAAMIANGSAIIYKIRSAQGTEETKGYFTDAIIFALLGSIPFIIIGIGAASFATKISTAIVILVYNFLILERMALSRS